MLMLKNVLFSLILVSTFTDVRAQNGFDKTASDIAQTLASKLKSSSTTRVAVADFVDLQGNTTELGKYIAESFSVQFVNTQLQVVDRSRLDYLIKELNLTKENLVRPENALKLGQMAGIQYLITGTTTMLDNSIDITIKAYDIEKGIIAAAQKGNLPRTDAINELFRSQVSSSGGGSGKPSAVSTMAQPLGSITVDANDDANQIKTTPMKKSICKDENSGEFKGYVCFENQTKYDLVLTREDPYYAGLNIMIASGGKGCSTLLFTNYTRNGSEPASKQYTFYFQTTDKEHPRYTKFNMVVEGCVAKAVLLDTRNLAFSDHAL